MGGIRIAGDPHPPTVAALQGGWQGASPRVSDRCRKCAEEHRNELESLVSPPSRLFSAIADRGTNNNR